MNFFKIVSSTFNRKSINSASFSDLYRKSQIIIENVLQNENNVFACSLSYVNKVIFSNGFRHPLSIHALQSTSEFALQSSCKKMVVQDVYERERFSTKNYPGSSPMKMFVRNYSSRHFHSRDNGTENPPTYEELYKDALKRIEEMMLEIAALKTEQQQVSSIFGAFLGRSVIEEVYLKHINPYMPVKPCSQAEDGFKKRGDYTPSEFVQGYTNFLESSEPLAILLKNKFPGQSSRQIAKRIVKTYRILSHVAHSVYTSTHFAHDIPTCMKFVKSVSLVNSKELKLLNKLMNTLQEYEEKFEEASQ